MTFVNNIEIRRNPKNSKLQYRCRYDIYIDGKRSRRRTKWCTSEDAVRHEAERKRVDKAVEVKKEERKIRDKAISTYMDEYIDWILSQPLDTSFSASERRSVVTRMKAIRSIIDVSGLTAGNIEERDVHMWGSQLSSYVAPRTGKTISASYYNYLAIETM